MINTSQNLNMSYGYLWWLNGKQSFMAPGFQTVFPGYMMPDAPADAYSALGKNGQILSVSPSSNLLFIRMGDNPTGPVNVTMPNDIWKKLGELECIATSINTSAFPDIHLYPNPANDKLKISGLDHSVPFTVEIYNAQGKLCDNINGQDALDITALFTGMYFLKIIQDGRTLREKFVKQ